MIASSASPATGVTQMGDYRLYFIDSDGHFIRAFLLDCANDKAAIESAKQYTHGYDIELWQRDRQVAKFERQERA
jgi:hypothetical protein